ncbi:MAG: ATP-binding protein, partial [Bacteroidetes bacterium]|nr:ATP-binding protein [Bacteroidota bacterium]
MSLNTSLKGRLRNTSLPKSNVLFPLFEAVVNSIHSIDERLESEKSKDRSNSFIKIKILRSTQKSIDDSTLPDITGFEITDNGVGFNSQNFSSFQTLDTEYKLQKGCRGVGRLLWLKAFHKVSIISCFKEENKKQKRTFDFNITNDIFNENIDDVANNAEIQTSIKLLELDPEYEKYLPKTIETIANALLEHCLWYYLREGSAPRITIEDISGAVNLDKLFDSYMLNASKPDEFDLKGETFSITHVKLKTSSHIKHSIIYSAADRVVKEESLAGKISGLFGVLNDGKDDFCYKCFVTSKFLTESVNPERLGFNISETIEGIYQASEISFKEIRENVIESVATYLDSYLQENRKIGLQKVSDYVATKAPRYRPILERIAEKDRIVDPSISDKDLEIKLHEHLMLIESELIAEGHELMKPVTDDNEEEYYAKIEDYLSKASDLKKSDLANYVAHRKVILDLFKKAIEIDDKGKYVKED